MRIEIGDVVRRASWPPRPCPVRNGAPSFHPALLSMRVFLPTLLAALVVLAGCDAIEPAPSDLADAAPAPYRIDGPSLVVDGSCDTFTVEDASGVPQAAYSWTVSGSGYLTNATTSSALVLATAPSSYLVSARVGSPSGPFVSKRVSVIYNPRGTAEC